MEAVTEKPVCGNCGADVREGTQFCFNCGRSVRSAQAIEEPGDASSDTETVEMAPIAELDPAFETSAPSPSNGNRAKTAASERKKARAARVKTIETEWAEPSDAANTVFVVASLAIFVIAAIVVAVMFLLR